MLIVDTGPLVALGDRKDPDHDACLDLLSTEPGPLLTTAMVIAEAAYLLARQVGTDGELALYADIESGLFTVELLTLGDWQRIAELVDRYRDLPLGGTDASVVALAERFGTQHIATIDHRHFQIVRPAHCDTFTLLP
ncbi:MAG: PIN domain-containing protein [Acidimicrobiales bacterium]|nr:PIN domain-containing protein [Acidimicrobiales bacterium]MCB1261537.1 PIN domain-containing protein [Acidimicrobiales bacterium]